MLTHVQGPSPTPPQPTGQNLPDLSPGATDFSIPSETSPVVAEPSLTTGVEKIFAAHKQFFDKLMMRIDALGQKEKEFRADPNFDPKSAEYHHFQQERMAEFFQLQLQAQQIQIGVETASKVIEHATSGVRTTLQTQT
ncbi:MAG: hypothetical protein KDB53_01280 [Planctomycetes bacterium]|nr:hypothetical protein [Planctomycetota bacterium]